MLVQLSALVFHILFHKWIFPSSKPQLECKCHKGRVPDWFAVLDLAGDMQEMFRRLRRINCC